MNPYWDELSFSEKPRTPVKEEDLSDFIDYKNFDSLFNDALTTLQDLDVPSGPMLSQNSQHQTGAAPSSGSFSPYKHSKKPSGTAIFGFLDHNRELSINGYSNDVLKPSRQSMDFGKSISPTQLARKSIAPISNDHLDFNFSQPLEEMKPIHINEDDEYEEEGLPQDVPPPSQPRKQDDYIVTNSNPKLYKFPPSPPPFNMDQNYLRPSTPVSQFINLEDKGASYPDDIEPLLETPVKNQGYVPIPVQNPTALPRRRQTPPKTDSRIAQTDANSPPLNTLDDTSSIQAFSQKNHHLNLGMSLEGTHNPLNVANDPKVYLPPPASQTTSLSDYQTSPEPCSPTLPHAQMNNLFTSPVHRMPPPRPTTQTLSSPYTHPKKDMYTRQFFSDDVDPYYSEPQPSSDLQSLPFYDGGFSPLKSSPLKHRLPQDSSGADDTVTDVNETIVQLTPLKNSAPPITPSKNKITLEWSPIISPSAKATNDVRRAIQSLSPKRTIKKTSLLPPGELDRYWEGPDENKIFTCTYKGCGKKFTRRYNVRSHIQTHLSDRPFGCSYCSKSFVRQHDLNRHIKSHNISKHTRCSCGKEFTRIEGYKRHLAKGICVKVPDNEYCGVKKPSPTKGAITDNVLDGLRSNRLTEELEMQARS